jgi:4-amino-4-deoxy-L-arabinose transferase-like glycosyltransferase
MGRRALESPHSGAPAELGQVSVSQRLSEGISTAHSLNEVRWRWGAWTVLTLTVILYFARLGARALWASEFRWGEIAREMLLTRDFFWPTINGHVYFDKPLGSYWLVIASSLITGRVDEAAVRVPSAVAGVLAVALLILLASRLYDHETGVSAGFILATSFSFVFWARTGSADVETIAGTLAALLIFKTNENRPGWWLVPMWLMMALTSLMKGLLGFVLPILVIGVYSCVADGWQELKRRLLRGPFQSRITWLVERNRWFFNWHSAVAASLGVVVYCAPFAVSYARSGSATGIYMVYRENLERYFAPFDHRGPIYLYVYVIFGLMMPWSAFLPAALVHAHQPGDPETAKARADRFVLTFFWTTFIFFSSSGSRRSYYILPILPPAAIMVARIFEETNKDLNRVTQLLLKAGYVLVLTAVALSWLALLPPKLVLPLPYSSWPIVPQREIFAACWIVALSTAAYGLIRHRLQPRFISLAIISYALMFYLFVVALPAGDQWRGEKYFAQQTRRIIGGHPTELAAFNVLPPIFYLKLANPVPQFYTRAELEAAIHDGQVNWVILRQRDLPELAMPVQEVAFEPTYPWDSREHRLNALVLVQMEH